MAIRLGINGFGRIGRLALRAAAAQPERFEIVGINDHSKSADYLIYMAKYDSIHGRFPGTLDVADGHPVVNGKKITLFNGNDPSEIAWGTCGADYVIESTGKFTTWRRPEAPQRRRQKGHRMAPSPMRPCLYMASISPAMTQR
jgi:glyceraldehyde 3-phosphate dehydrogenase